MPRTRAPAVVRDELAALTDDELACISFFGNLVDPSGEVLYTATQAQMAEAWRLFRARRGDA
jgi:hypothetical protein